VAAAGVGPPVDQVLLDAAAGAKEAGKTACTTARAPGMQCMRAGSHSFSSSTSVAAELPPPPHGPPSSFSGACGWLQGNASVCRPSNQPPAACVLSISGQHAIRPACRLLILLLAAAFCELPLPPLLIRGPVAGYRAVRQCERLAPLQSATMITGHAISSIQPGRGGASPQNRELSSQPACPAAPAQHVARGLKGVTSLPLFRRSSAPLQASRGCRERDKARRI
jgi:hypothetical protein